MRRKMKDNYLLYLKSKDWKERRKELMIEANWECCKCGEKAKQLHHLNYHCLGEEELNEDVVALCKDCHDEIHGKGNYGYEEYKGY